MLRRHRLVFIFLAAFFAVTGAAAADVFHMGPGLTNIEFVAVGNPGNAPDTVVMGDGTAGYGSVPYSYQIDKYDVTNSQYADFLNTKDPSGTNTLGLWNSLMADPRLGGINFSAGNAAARKYTPTAGRENRPVNYETWYDAIRFANWLNNGQGSGDTESGAYTLVGNTPIPTNGDSVTRNAGAKVFLPSESEWYKAAYYDPATSSYFQYGTSSNSTPIASGPTPTGIANHANFVRGGPGDLTDVAPIRKPRAPTARSIWLAMYINGTKR